MKKYFLLIILIVPEIVPAQNNMEGGFIPVSDSTLSCVIQEKEKFIHSFLFGFTDQSMEIFQKLKSEYAKDYLIFKPSEENNFQLAVRNFRQFLAGIKNSEDYSHEKVTLPDSLYYEADMNSYLRSECESLETDLDTAGLEKADKEFIRIYLHGYSDIDRWKHNSEINGYQKEFSDSPYNKILENKTDDPAAFLFTVNAGIGNRVLSGSMVDYYSKSHLTTFHLEFDSFIKRFYCSFLFSGNLESFVTNQDMPVKNKGLTHKKGEKAGNFKLGVKGGYIILQSRRFLVYPFISTGLFSMISNSPDFKSDGDEEEIFSLSDSFFTGFGISSDIYLKSWNNRKNFEPDIRLYLRPTVDYDFILSNKSVAKGKSLNYSISLGVAFSDF